MRYATHNLDTATPVIGVAVHNGHELRDEIAAIMALDERTRTREEDPYTGMLASVLPSSLVVHRSRFEVDLNRPRDEAVYRQPEEAWGLQLWRTSLPEDVAGQSLDLYDDFYEGLGELLDGFLIRHGGFVLYDIHSYNHRRDGRETEPASKLESPDLNLGTGSLPPRWKPVAEAFLEAAQRAGLDARENVKFEGRQVAGWVHENFGHHGCALAMEFKKTFMDEWTGELYEDRLEELKRFIEGSVDPIVETLKANGG